MKDKATGKERLYMAVTKDRLSLPLAVPPPFAEALVRANLPEMCGRRFETMQELHGVI